MHTSLARLASAALALLSILGACASSTGATWTYAPVTATLESPAGSEAPAASPGTQATEAPAAGSQPAGSAGPAGEARVIDLVATASLQFTTPDGTQVTDIAVTPGEAILFRVDNTAGFDHDFYIGTDAELSVPNATTDVGIPMWQSGVQELTWVVPEDISGLKFGCTVPGHYAAGMQGTFSAGEAAPPAAAGSQAPAGSAAAEEPAASAHESMAMASGAPAEASAAPAGSAPAAGSEAPSAEGRVIDLVATAALQFTTPDGTQVTDIPVTPGETITFRVDNTAGFDHNFYIGTDAELNVPSATTETGIPTWQSGVQELTWVVPDDVSGLKFGCTIPGHYALMQGTFSAAA
jgi:uncharacterized cupredoxin-like copper-binding protein